MGADPHVVHFDAALPGHRVAEPPGHGGAKMTLYVLACVAGAAYRRCALPTVLQHGPRGTGNAGNLHVHFGSRLPRLSHAGPRFRSRARNQPLRRDRRRAANLVRKSLPVPLMAIVGAGIAVLDAGIVRQAAPGHADWRAMWKIVAFSVGPSTSRYRSQPPRLMRSTRRAGLVRLRRHCWSMIDRPRGERWPRASPSTLPTARPRSRPSSWLRLATQPGGCRARSSRNHRDVRPPPSVCPTEALLSFKTHHGRITRRRFTDD